MLATSMVLRGLTSCSQAALQGYEPPCDRRTSARRVRPRRRLMRVRRQVMTSVRMYVIHTVDVPARPSITMHARRRMRHPVHMRIISAPRYIMSASIRMSVMHPGSGVRRVRMRLQDGVRTTSASMEPYWRRLLMILHLANGKKP